MADDFSNALSSAPPKATTLRPKPKKNKKNRGLPWKTMILPVALWLFCAAELVLLFLIPDSPNKLKTAIPTPILEIKTTHLPLPAPFCPGPANFAGQAYSTNAAPLIHAADSLRIERLPAQAESPQTLAADFFQKGVRYSLNKEWRAAADAFFKAQHFFPESPEYAFNLALSLEHLGDKRQAIFYYEKALSNARQQTHRPANFDKQMLTRHLESLKK